MRLTDQELKVVLDLCDIGLKSAGLQIAVPVTQLALRCTEELNKRQQEAQSDPTEAVAEKIKQRAKNTVPPKTATKR